MKPLLIVLIGLVFLLRSLGKLDAHTADVAWPILLMAFGAMKMCGPSCKCCAKH